MGISPRRRCDALSQAELLRLSVPPLQRPRRGQALRAGATVNVERVRQAARLFDGLARSAAALELSGVDEVQLATPTLPETVSLMLATVEVAALLAGVEWHGDP